MSRIKDHIEKHQKTYILAAGIAGGLVAGAAIAVQLRPINISAEGNANQIVGQAKTVNQVMVNLVERSTPSKPVHLVGTNLYFNSLSEAARETGHNLSKISKQVNGLPADLGGDVFELLELAS